MDEVQVSGASDLELGRAIRLADDGDLLGVLSAGLLQELTDFADLLRHLDCFCLLPNLNKL